MSEHDADKLAVETKDCRYGRVSFFTNDSVIGKSLREYGEWAQSELYLLVAAIHAGDTVIDIGAFIGTHTLAFSSAVGPEGSVLAFEPQTSSFELLRKNIEQNVISNTTLFNAALGDTLGTMSLGQSLVVDNPGSSSLADVTHEKSDITGSAIQVLTLDSCKLDKCSLIKVDTEGMELSVLKGAVQTLSLCRPIVFAEVISLEKGWPLISWMRDRKFDAFLHNAIAYNPANFNHNPVNYFGEAREVNILFLPMEKTERFLETCSNKELIPVKSIDDLALGLMKKPQYKQEVLAKTEASKVFGVGFFANEPEMIQLRNELASEQLEIAAKTDALTQLQQLVKQFRSQVDKLEVELRESRSQHESELRAIRNSVSWRITRPLRFVGAASRLLNQRTIRIALTDLSRGNVSGVASKAKNAFQQLPSSSEPSAIGSLSNPEEFEIHSFLNWLGPKRNASFVLTIDHGLGGGANQYRERWTENQLEQGTSVLLVYYALWESQYRIRYIGPDTKHEWYAKSLDPLREIASSLRPNEIFFNNAYSFPDPLILPDLLVELKSRAGSRLTFAIHDYFAICPSYILLNNQNIFCNVPHMDQCRNCLPRNKGEYFALASGKDIDQWRDTWLRCLQRATSILCFSECSKELVMKAYPDLDPGLFEVRPHVVDYIKTKAFVKAGPLNVGVLGALSEHKGAGIVREMVRLIDENSLPVSVTVIGTMESIPKSKSIRVTGRYQHADIPLIIEETGANVFLVASIWPETFCYVADELMALDVPVAAFDIGAPPERLRNYKKSLIIKEISAGAALNELIDFHKRLWGNQ